MDNIEYNKLVNYFKVDCDLKFEKDLDYWGYTAIDYNYINCLEELYNDGDRFLELGCGPGNVLKVAKDFGYDVTGVEIDKKYEEYLKDYNYIIGDITKLDYDFYNKFDFIYTHKPLKKGLKKYLDIVTDNMKNGAILYTPFLNYEKINFEKIGTCKIKKIK